MAPLPPITSNRQAMPADGFMANVEKISLDGLMNQIKGGGPDMDRDIAALKDKQQRMQELFAMVFSADEGREVLEHLLDITLRRPAIVQGLTSDQRAEYYIWREGENRIVWQILQMIASGLKLKPQPREGA
jgi:hypothetical protein